MPTWLWFMLLGTAAPIENSPPGIHTMPLGVRPGSRFVFGTVDLNTGSVSAGLSASV
ncbi:hypothetical protein [Nitrosomonas sp. Nm132]|uniref:hypothetical protein n=1 Tax=Nitrosomonas sp. Nm132 TaxID=1881053 RepID=UPI00159FFDB8|nr:hypothetical protein [Nitrosomonas sp. Nm132]